MSQSNESWWVGRARYYRERAKPKLSFDRISEELGRPIPEIRIALGLPVWEPYERAEKPMEGEPAWVKRARYLRTRKKMSVQAVADEMDMPYRRVYKALHPRRVRDTNRRYGQRSRSDLSQRQLAARRAKSPRCVRCDEPMTVIPKGEAICPTCRSERYSERLEAVVELWNAEWSTREVGEHVGLPDNQVAAMLTMARKRGYGVRRVRAVSKRHLASAHVVS